MSSLSRYIFKLIFSGLTEYFFALVLITGIYFVTRSKYISALILLSFLPLIRSEGLIILGVFGFYFLINKKYKLLPYLLFGQLLYCITGSFYNKDFLWVFTDIPYAYLSSPHGNGEIYSFIIKLNHVIEKPTYILFVIGIISNFYSLIQNGIKKTDVKLILIFGSFIAIFTAHSIFWWKGIFNSMGLTRVLICIVPMVIVFSLIGIQTLTYKIKNLKMKYSTVASISFIVCIYPFLPLQNYIVYNKKMFTLEENNIVNEEALPYIQKEFPDYQNTKLYFSHPYLGIALDVDYFDPMKRRDIKFLRVDEIKNDEIIIWDEWYSVVESKITLDFLLNDERFEFMHIFERKENDRIITYAVFKTKVVNR